MNLVTVCFHHLFLSGFKLVSVILHRYTPHSALQISTKSVKECIQFYYLWKKVCPDDYKRLRTLRRKRHQNTLYNLRSQQPTSGGEPTPPPQGAGGVPGQEEYDYDGSDSETEDQTGTNGMVSTDLYTILGFLALAFLCLWPSIAWAVW